MIVGGVGIGGVFRMNEWVDFIHGGGCEINVLKKWSSNDSSGLGFLRHNAKISQELGVLTIST